MATSRIQNTGIRTKVTACKSTICDPMIANFGPMILLRAKPSSAETELIVPFDQAETTGEESHHNDSTAGPTNHTVDHTSTHICLLTEKCKIPMMRTKPDLAMAASRFHESSPSGKTNHRTAKAKAPSKESCKAKKSPRIHSMLDNTKLMTNATANQRRNVVISWGVYHTCDKDFMLPPPLHWFVSCIPKRRRPASRR